MGGAPSLPPAALAARPQRAAPAVSKGVQQGPASGPPPVARGKAAVVEVSQAARARSAQLRKAVQAAESTPQVRPRILKLPDADSLPPAKVFTARVVLNKGETERHRGNLNGNVQIGQTPRDEWNRGPLHAIKHRVPGKATADRGQQSFQAPNVGPRIGRGEKVFDAVEIQDPNSQQMRAMRDSFLKRARK